MIITKNILSVCKCAIYNDPFSPNGIVIKREENNIIAYATNGHLGFKVTTKEFDAEEYPYMDDYSANHKDYVFKFDKDTCMYMMKMTKKNKIPILNNTLLIDEESFNETMNTITVVSTDLSTTSKTIVKCETGNDCVESFESFIESCPSKESESCKEVGFNPFYMSDICLIIAEVCGLTRKESHAIQYFQPIDKFHAIVLECDYNGVKVECFLMPKII